MPRLSPLCIAWVCATLATPHTFAAPAVWRCGHNSYSDTPCQDGVSVGTGTSPSADQRRQADEGTRKDQAAAQRMQRERQQLEASQINNRAVVIGPQPRETRPTPPAAALTPPKKKGAAKPDAFVASGTDPQAKPRRKKTRDAAAGG